MTAGLVWLFVPACTSQEQSHGDADTGIAAMEVEAFTQGPFAVSAVHTCDAPADEARWTELSATWGYDYELLPGPSLAQNPGALALLGSPGAWRIAWAGPDTTYAANLDGSAAETWFDGTASALVVRDLDADGADELLYLGSVIGVA